MMGKLAEVCDLSADSLFQRYAYDWLTSFRWLIPTIVVGTVPPTLPPSVPPVSSLVNTDTRRLWATTSVPWCWIPSNWLMVSCLWRPFVWRRSLWSCMRTEPSPSRGMLLQNPSMFSIKKSEFNSTKIYEELPISIDMNPLSRALLNQAMMDTNYDFNSIHSSIATSSFLVCFLKLLIYSIGKELRRAD